MKRALAPWEKSIQSIEVIEQREGYREQSDLRVQLNQEGEWEFGFVRSTRERDEFIALPGCPVHSPRVRQALSKLAELLRGVLRSEDSLFAVLVRGELLTLVFKSRELPACLQNMNWSDLLPEIQGVFAVAYPSAGRKLVTPKGWTHLWGVQRGMREGFTYGPRSFTQVLPELAARALDRATEFLHPGAQTSVLDLYSGIGTSLKRWQACGSATLGIELSSEGVSFARENVPGILVHQGRVVDRLPQIREWRRAQAEHERLVYMNPSRLGVEHEVLKWIVTEDQPSRIVYLSCSPGTLARDLRILTQHRQYQVLQVIPYDFFPQTQHVEVLVFLQRILAI